MKIELDTLEDVNNGEIDEEIIKSRLIQAIKYLPINNSLKVSKYF